MNTVRALLWLLPIQCALSITCMTGKRVVAKALGPAPAVPEFCPWTVGPWTTAGQKTCDVCVKLQQTDAKGNMAVLQMCKEKYEELTKAAVDLPALQCGKETPKLKEGVTGRYDCCKQGDACDFSKGTVGDLNSQQCMLIKALEQKFAEEQRQKQLTQSNKCMTGMYIYQMVEPEEPEFCSLGNVRAAGHQKCDLCVKMVTTNPQGTTTVLQMCQEKFREMRDIINGLFDNVPAFQCGTEVPADQLKKGYRQRFDCCKQGGACDFSKGSAAKSYSPQCKKLNDMAEKGNREIMRGIGSTTTVTAPFPFLMACALLLSAV